jgi:hypothetical protein
MDHIITAILLNNSNRTKSIQMRITVTYKCIGTYVVLVNVLSIKSIDDSKTDWTDDNDNGL